MSFGTGSPVHSHFWTSCDDCSCTSSAAGYDAVLAARIGFPVKASVRLTGVDAQIEQQ